MAVPLDVTRMGADRGRIVLGTFGRGWARAPGTTFVPRGDPLVVASSTV